MDIESNNLGKPDIILKPGPHVFSFAKKDHEHLKIPYNQWVRLKCHITDNGSQTGSSRNLVQVQEFEVLNDKALPKSPTHIESISGVLVDLDGKRFLKTKSGLRALIQDKNSKNSRVAVEVFGAIGDLKPTSKTGKQVPSNIGVMLQIEGISFSNSNRFEVRSFRYLNLNNLLGKKLIVANPNSSFPKRIEINRESALVLLQAPQNKLAQQPCFVTGTLVKTPRPYWEKFHSSEKSEWFQLKNPCYLLETDKTSTPVDSRIQNKMTYPIFDSPNSFSDGVLDLRHQYYYINKPPFPPRIHGFLNTNYRLIRQIIKRDSPHTRSILHKRLKDPERSFEVKLINAIILASLQDTAGVEHLRLQLKENKNRSDDIFLAISKIEYFRSWKEKTTVSRSRKEQIRPDPPLLKKILAIDAEPTDHPNLPKIEKWVVSDLKKILFRHPEILKRQTEFLKLDEKGRPIFEEILTEETNNLNEQQVRHLYQSDLLIALAKSGDKEVIDFLLRVLTKYKQQVGAELKRLNFKEFRNNESDWYGYPMGKLADRALLALAYSEDPRAVSLTCDFAMMDISYHPMIYNLLISSLAKKDINRLTQLFVNRLKNSSENSKELFLDYLSLCGKENAMIPIKNKIEEFDEKTRPYAEFLILRWEGASLESLLDSKQITVKWLAAREMSKSKSEPNAELLLKKLKAWGSKEFERTSPTLYRLYIQSIDNCITGNRQASIRRLIDLVDDSWQFNHASYDGSNVRAYILKKLASLTDQNLPYDQELWFEWLNRQSSH